MSDLIQRICKTIDDLREAAKLLRNDPEICSDPLMIELFASNLNARSCEGIADRLEHNLEEAGLIGLSRRPASKGFDFDLKREPEPEPKPQKGPRIVKLEPDKSVEKTAICRNGCGATVAYVPNDIARSGYRDGYTYVICPNCRKEVVVGHS